MLPQGVACYLINLDRSPGRLADMLPRLEALGIAFERVPGVDGMTLDEGEFAAQTRENRYYKPLRRGEVGCQLSHLKALQAFLGSDARYALVLEDDALLDPAFVEVLRAAIALRDRDPDPIRQWDVLKLNRNRRRHVDLAPLGEGHRLVEYGLSVPITTAAAVWTRSAAAAWVRMYRGTSRPIDCDLQHPWEYGLKIRSVHPAIVVQGNVASSMGSDKLVARNPWPKLRYELKRMWPKLRSFGSSYGWVFISGWLWKHRLAYRPHDQGG
ncbi:MAG: glycosyltransferase family 25 protein [Lysobacteraceae bacterium]|nr:MAG: glycosyltransferase family 25 protein [Xanthomonadaceae bacterium]